MTSRYTALTLPELEAEEAALQCALDAARGRVSRWLPIETAPRDGTPVLAWCPKARRVILRINGTHMETWSIDPTGQFDCEPLYWMPLPPAPLAGEA